MTSLTARAGRTPRFLCKHAACHARLSWSARARLLIPPDRWRCNLSDVQCSSSNQATLACDAEQLHQSRHTHVAFKVVQTLLGTLVIAAAFAAFLCGQGGGSSQFASATAATANGGAQLAVASSASGMAAGFLHTLCGPDHLAALTPLTIGRNRFAASLLGSLWGLGHCSGQLVLAVLFALLKERFTSLIPFLERWAAVVVGLTLVVIGGLGILEARESAAHTSADGQTVGSHTESEDEAALRQIVEREGEGRIAIATYATGILYGLQPDALFVVIPALALPSKAAAFAYGIMFVVGTVVAMGGYTLFIGTASEELCRDRPWLRQNLSTGAGIIAILVGGAILAAGLGFSVPLFGH